VAQDGEQVLRPRHTTGKVRRPHRAYRCKPSQAARLASRGAHAAAPACRQQRRTLPRGDPQDPGDRRLRDARYADDVVPGFTGPRVEAAAIKRHLGHVLRDPLRLPRSAGNTLITHGRTAAARGLGYEMVVVHADHTPDQAGRRVVNGKIG
jgi:hypothetical protein